MNNYKPTIGIEVHIELKTNSKVFSPSKNDYNALINSNVNEIDLGYPGTLPTINKKVLENALISALALNCNISKKMHFDRKNYFYPDLPKGYQITQARTPIGYDGYLEINMGTYTKKIGIERVHIEEDTAKSMHTDSKTLLNYNRAGVPLIEIVSKPDIENKEEAMKYLETLRELLFYLGVSDCKIEEGSMRADVNVSISNTSILGTKCEVKNIGSISNVGQAITSEIKRQSTLLENGETIYEETRRFDNTTSDTISMRKKEIGNDYRYFPEPDIPYLYISEKDIENAKEKLILLPKERRSIYKEKGILDINIDKILNKKELSDYLNQFINKNIDFKIASNLLLGDISNYLNNNKISIFDTKLNENKFINIVNMLSSGEITNKIFKDIINDIMEKDLSIQDILKQKNIVISNNIEDLEKIINKVLDNYKESVNEYKNGKENAFKFLMGMVMKEVKGTFNPKLVNETLLNTLKNNN